MRTGYQPQRTSEKKESEQEVAPIRIWCVETICAIAMARKVIHPPYLPDAANGRTQGRLSKETDYCGPAVSEPADGPIDDLLVTAMIRP